jgi:nicotinamidase-related amidase
MCNGGELTIASAQPFPYKMPPTGRVALIMIDWQRDFLEEGGFGHALGNDISTLRRGLGPAAAVLTAARACGVPIIHTLETHKPDLSDLPAAKLLRCPAIGKALEAEPARGRLLVAGELGNGIVDEVAPIAGELVLHKPGKGAFCGTALHDELRARGVTHLLVTGVTTEVCVQSTPAG